MAALEHSRSRGQIPLWLKVLWTVWLLVWAPIYWKYYGPQNLLFFCDLGIFFVAAALWLESALIFSWQAVSLLIFETLFVLDLAGALFSGQHILSASNFMFSSQLPLFVRLLTLFHVVTPPLLIWAIWKLGYDRRGLKYQIITLWILLPINYFWRPEQDVNWARGLFFHQQHLVPGPVYLLAYLIVVPIVIYLPTHWALSCRARSCGRLRP